MTDNTARTFIDEVLHLYDKGSHKLLLYFSVLVFSTGTALVLEWSFGMPPATVLLYTGGLITVLLIMPPVVCVVLRRMFVSDILGRTSGSSQFLPVAAPLSVAFDYFLSGLLGKEPKLEAASQTPRKLSTENAVRIRAVLRRLDGGMVSPDVAMVSARLLEALWLSEGEHFELHSPQTEQAVNEYARGKNEAIRIVLGELEMIIANKWGHIEADESFSEGIAFHHGLREVLGPDEVFGLKQFKPRGTTKT